MQSRKLILLGTLISFLLFSGVMGCGEGGSSSGPDLGSGASTLSLSPTGPVSIKKGQSIDFDTNLPGASFTVVGGASNGSIDANGVYTPPSVFPPNTHITIQANVGSQTASTKVNLLTADALTIQSSSRKQISDANISSSALTKDSMLGSLQDRMALSETEGNITIYSLWTQKEGGNFTGLFDLSQNFGAFASDKHVGALLNNPLATSIQTDSTGKIHMVVVEENSGSYLVIHYVTDNNGSTFASHIVASSPNNQGMAQLRIDAQDRLHLVFVQEVAPGKVAVLYTRSSNGGISWDSPLTVNPEIAPRQYQPSLAINKAGNSIDICWTEYVGSKTDIFAAHKSDADLTFGSAKNLSNTASISEGQCQIAQNSSGDIYVIYAGLYMFLITEDDEVHFVKSSDHATTFTLPIAVNSDTAHFQAFPSMSVDSQDRIDIVWSSDLDVDGSDRPEAILHSRSLDAGNSFSNNETIINDAGNTVSIVTGMQHDSAGRLHLQYLSRIGSDLNLFYEMAE